MILRTFERALFASRWLLLPFLVGLVVGLAILLLRFGKEVWDLASIVWTGSDKELLTGLLTLIEVTLIAALIVIVILSSYENFVSRVRAEDHPEWPAWMGHVDFAQLKRKLIATITTIACVQVLKDLESIEDLSNRYLGWLLGIVIAVAGTALILSLADRVAEGVKNRDTG